MIPELKNEESEEANALTKEFSSADTVLDLPGTIDLLNRHGLILEAGDEMPAEDELLR
jgi:hypothetical protein